MMATRSQSAGADASAKYSFTPSPESQKAGHSVTKVPSVLPHIHTPTKPTGPYRIEAASRFAHRDMAYVGVVGRHGSQAWLEKVTDDNYCERDIFHVEIQCTCRLREV